MVPTSKLTSNVEQWTNLQKVFEEREHITTYTLCREWEVFVEKKQKQVDQCGPTSEVATSTIEPQIDLKKLLEERAPQQQQELPQQKQLPLQQPPSRQQQQQ
jgi:hypothetical protein